MNSARRWRRPSAQPGPAVIGVPIDYGENMKLSARLGKIEYPI